MKKRFMCLLLALVMLVGILPMSTVTASAAANGKTSESGIQVIKDFVGFHEKSYAVDTLSYKIGYGTHSTYNQTITKEKADFALREELETIDKAINTVLNTTYGGLEIVQKQHDALAWYMHVYGSGILNTAVMNVLTNPASKSSDIANAIATIGFTTSFSGTKENKAIVESRLAMANLFLNGTYKAKDTGTLAYTMFDANGGYIDGVAATRIQAYDSAYGNQIKITAPTNGVIRFAGWYVDYQGKSYNVTELNSYTKGATLVARWGIGPLEIESNYYMPASVLFAINGTPTNQQLYVYSMPIPYSTMDPNMKVDALFREDWVTVVGESTILNLDTGVMEKWVQLKTGGWVRLGDVNNIPVFVTPSKVKVTDDYVNLREGAGVNFEKLSMAPYGKELTIYMISPDGNWGYTTDGWVYLIYTDYFDQNKGSDSKYEIVATGTVNAGTTLNVRAKPNAGSARVGGLADGTKVNIYEITTTAGHKWGLTEMGWICLDYVSLNSTPEKNDSSVNRGSAAVIANAAEVNVRSGAGLDKAVVMKLPQGSPVTVYEVTTVGTADWARISQGWVCTDYLEMNGYQPSAKVATVEPGISLVVRSGPGSEYSKVTTLAPGTSVGIESIQTVQGVQWAKIAQGYINLNYCSISNAGSETKGIGGYIVNCSTAANVRSAPGTTSALKGTIAVGSRVTVTEREMKNGHYWGHIEKGWVCMDYVQLDREWSDPVAPVDPGVGLPVIITFDGYPATMLSDAPLRQEASSDAKTLMTLKNGAAIKIVERKLTGEKEFGKVVVGDISGWVNMNKVSMDTLYVRVATSKADAYEEPNVRSKFFTALPTGTAITIVEQKFDGIVTWGKGTITIDGKNHDAWLDLADCQINYNNTAPNMNYTLNGVGYLTGKVNAGGVNVKADVNGEPGSDLTEYKLVEGTTVNLLSRILVGGKTFGKVKVGSIYGWINLENVTLDRVELAVAVDSMTTYTTLGGSVEGKKLSYGDVLTVLERKLVKYEYGVNDWGKVFVNDDTTDIRYVILDEGKVAYTTKAVEDIDFGSIMTTVVVTGVAKHKIAVHEEADTASTSDLEIKKDNNVTILNWKNVGTTTWGKVQVGNIVGWVDVSEVDFSTLTGIVKVDDLKVYAKPDVDSTIALYNVKGRELRIKNMKFDGKTLWGNVDVGVNNGWVNLASLTLSVPTTNAPGITGATLISGRINSVNNKVTVYEDPFQASPVAGDLTLPKNTQVSIIDLKTYGGKAWALIELGEKDGWVNTDFIAMNPSNAKIAVSSIELLNDLTGGTKVVETLYRDERIDVLSYQVHGNKLYGEVELDDNTAWLLLCEGTGADALVVSLTPYTAGSSSSIPTATTVPPTVAPAPTAPVGSPATIVGAPTVNVRSGAGVNYPQVSTLNNGAAVTVYEQTTVNGKGWARVDTGWVCMDYVQMGSGTTSGVINTPVVMTTVPAGAVAAGFANQELAVYGGPGFGYGKSGSIVKNSAVVVYENKLAEGVSWARTDKGWIILSYVTVTAIGQNGSGTMGTITGVGFTANVRSAAGISGLELTKVMISSRVAITDTQVVSGESWGKTALGWINLKYVVLDTDAAAPIINAGMTSGSPAEAG